MSNKTEPPRRLSGTKEWADFTYNFQMGCEHDCKYCYARQRAVERYKYCKSHEAWRNPVINAAKVNANITKNYGTVMFPSTHDITPANIYAYCTVLGKLLAAGNNVLIVSKPHIDCIRQICGEFKDYKDSILFRFTIGSTRDDVLGFWEPGAPGFKERSNCLKVAFELGFNTSVSCEPYLDERVGLTYMMCAPFVTESFWIGKMRNLASRVKLEGISEADVLRYVATQKAIQEEDWVRGMYRALDSKSLIKWKDSIREVITSA